MKKRFLAILLTSAMVLTTVGAGSTAALAEESADGSSVFRTLYSGEVTTLNYLTTGNTNDQEIGANTIDTLTEYDSDGNILPSLATDWTYDEDALTWTFTLREDQYWIDSDANIIADVTAQDFVDSMKYVLTPEYASSTASILFGVIANAEEYYNGLAGEGDEIDFEEVGVKAIDDYTLQYTLANEVPYFLSMLTYVTFMPAYGPQLEEEGANFATSADTMYYCGAYYLSSYDPQNQKILTKNPYNWDVDNVFIDEIQMVYNSEESTIGPEMAKRGEIDSTTLGSDIVDSWLADPETASMVSIERPAIDYSYFYCFNFNVQSLDEDFVRKDDGTYSISEEYEPWNWEIAVNNENFRQSIMHAISRISTVAVDTGGDADVAQNYIQNTITPEGFAVNEGVDYTDDSAFTEILASDFYDQDLATQYKEAAMEELEAEGVTFPVKVLVRYNPDTSNWEEECTVLEQQLEAVLGTDYIDVIVEAGPSDGFLGAVRRSSDYMLMLCNWGADYADPETYTDPFYQAQNADGSYDYGGRYAYLAYAITDDTASAETVQTYFDLVEAAKAETSDMDARYAAFAEAEAYLIDHALVVPYGTSVSDYIVTKLDVWEGQYAAFGVSSLRYKGQHLQDDFVSMDDYYASEAEHQ